jgi:hypothetical protein
MTRISGRATRPRPLVAIGMALAALALTTGGVAAAPPAAFTVSPTSLEYGSVFINDSLTQTVTVVTGRKDVVLDMETNNGQYFDAGTGTCLTSFTYQVPANTACTIDLTFAPFVAGPFPATMTISSCMKWHLLDGLPSCDMSHFSVSVSLDGSGENLP